VKVFEILLIQKTTWKFYMRLYNNRGARSSSKGRRSRLRKLIVITTAFVFFLCSTFSFCYATNTQAFQNSKKEILVSKGEKKEVEEKIEKLEKKNKELREDKEKIEKEIKENEKELKELKELKKKKS
jgi:peptidoglycan hydrolase CwlO-like protein